MQDFAFTFAHPDFYAPLESTPERGEVFRPTLMPEDWTDSGTGTWTLWRPPSHTLVRQGWKVHVSARPDRLGPVLDIVARACVDHGVAFKHISAKLFFLWLNHKHAARQQSGKFCALYPSDVDSARALMDRLSADLAGEDGPYILTDRRYGDSKTVHYRYGAFAGISRRQPDGTGLPMLAGPGGELVEDRRHVAFVLPPSVEDPFARPTDAESGGSSFHGLTFHAALQHSNAGGAYRATQDDTGRTVLVKEARGHTGLGWDERAAAERLRGEWEILVALHAASPGIAPEPLDHFREWEHEFMVTEFIEGVALKTWMVGHSTLIRSAPTRAEVARYYERCLRILTAVEERFARLHECGYVFVDVSPGNVIVTEDDGVRLVDFEAAHRIGDELRPMGTEGFTPPRELVDDDPTIYDRYGLAALAQFLLAPLQQVIQRHPDVLVHLRHDLEDLGPVPEPLWDRATAFHRPTGDTPLPGPEEVAQDPVRHVRDLRDRVASAIAAMAEPDHEERVYPTVPQGYASNTWCLAYGAAGVLHALRVAGEPVPAPVVERLRRHALDGSANLAPGLMYGAAGIAWVLADLGHLAEARALLDTADRHPITRAHHTYGSGSAGVAMTHLALYGHTRDRHHLDRAVALAEALPADADLAAGLGADNATGLLAGRCGIALMLQQLAAVTGEEHLLDRAVRLLHAELDRASDPNAADLAFPVSDTDTRSMPYVYCGSAGMLLATTRCLADRADERLAEAQPRLGLRLRGPFTIMAGLYQGIAGLGFAQAEHARLTGDETSRVAALRTARAMFKYAVPHETGVRFLGEGLSRYSADLWSGSAGILLSLSQVLDPRPDALFTVDRLATGRTTADRALSHTG